ncbi:MAG: hypothetical protein QXP42_03910 [Candidatus Micrarchaeia archaeon]
MTSKFCPLLSTAEEPNPCMPLCMWYVEGDCVIMRIYKEMKKGGGEGSKANIVRA